MHHLLCGKKRHIYRVIFEIDERRQVVYVLTIRHGAREPLEPQEIGHARTLIGPVAALTTPPH